MKKIAIAVVPLLICSTWAAFGQVKEIARILSPGAGTQLEVALFAQKQLKYRVSNQGKTVIGWSELGLELNFPDAVPGIKITGTTRSSHREKIVTRLGENQIIYNNYNQIRIKYLSQGTDLSVIFRVFNGSIAMQYLIANSGKLKEVTILKEKTEFRLPQAYTLYQYHQESVFTPIPLDSLTGSSDLPSTLAGNNSYISIGEADNTGYTKAELAPGSARGSLQIAFTKDKRVNAVLPFSSPWRTIGIAETATGLHHFSELPYKLAHPAASQTTNTPLAGKLIRAQLDTQSGFDCIDFAEKMNFQYIMFDAGWYGPERSTSSDPRVPIQAIDMERVVKYGQQHGIGVILYLNYMALRNHLDEILPLYKKWGIKGIKFGFIDGLTQSGTKWLATAMRKVNDSGLILNIHDNYKPTGLSRTFPFLLTQEGIRGDENSPDAFHTTVLPYTRFLAGAADFTFCFPNPKQQFAKNLKVSKAQQLALTVINFSPLQSIFWYGKPKDYTNWDEIAFFKTVPTVWDRSMYLQGEIGKNICVARKHGKKWFVGSAAGKYEWQGTLNLDFLDEGKSYQATIWTDTDNQKLSKKVLRIKKGFSLPFYIKPAGGLAIEISPG
ncbi:glycoside hydrolase family 97 protein [Pedobacter zeae]|uniref:Alpha-glucosidase n=1 Tax=Pedobacter zeae TaxID=1737356 RepID=A0A7W6P660_9SPHI|nr:glycoside hydrolase family 97 protein [Pedobacter zeae]MBB4107589.1 alpha-glucosidase [Pedobacter zeae]GGG98354.1 alpha-glucosidase [Pedobacter zeae]